MRTATLAKNAQAAAAPIAPAAKAVSVNPVIDQWNLRAAASAAEAAVSGDGRHPGRSRPAVRPIEKLDGMHECHARPALSAALSKLLEAADIACGDHFSTRG